MDPSAPAEATPSSSPTSSAPTPSTPRPAGTVSSTRAAMQKAFDTLSKEPAAPRPTPARPTPALQPAVAEPQGEDGQEAQEASTEPVQPRGEEPEGDEPEPAAEEKPGKHEKGPPSKAPQSWRPKAREMWAATPPDVQAEVLRREKEVSDTLRATVASRDVATRFEKAIQPYQAFIQGDPVQAVGQLLNFQARLQTGTPGDRAVVLAHLMKSFDVDAGKVAEHLGYKPEAPPGGKEQPPAAPQGPFRDDRLDVFLSKVEQQSQARAQAAAQALKRETDDFLGKNEFAPRLADSMATYMEVRHATTGVEPSMQEAYDWACRQDPEVSEVLAQRKAAQSASQPVPGGQRPRATSSSIASSPAAARKAPQPTTLRSQLEANQALLSRR